MRSLYLNKYRNNILLSIQGICLVLYLRNDPEPFHSGFVYSQSIAVSDGLLPNKNFLSPYGVIGPLLNGLWLFLVNNSLLSLLLLYGLISLSSSFLMSKEISRLTDQTTGLLLSSLWIITIATAMPWPSILTTFLTLFSIRTLIRNRERAFYDLASKHLYLIPVVAFLDLAVLTRIHLAITPLMISVYIFLKRKSLSSTFIKTWFYLQLIVGSSILLVLQSLGVLKPFIEQVIVWPLTEFNNPPTNFSFLFSFVWFPVALTILICLTFLIKYVNTASSRKILQFFWMMPGLVLFYLIYYFSKYEFSGSDVTTVKTLPGFIKTASVNLQFVTGYAAGSAAFIGLAFSILWKRNHIIWAKPSVHEYEFWLMTSLVFTGMIQLYPLHDNVHLWFITPLLLVPSIYFFKIIVINYHQYLKPFNTVLLSVLIIQLISFSSFLSTPRVALKSSELRGMMASAQYLDTTDRTMMLLDRYVSGRNLRNNCQAGLYSVAGRKYRSIDGNFTSNFFGNFVQTVPVVDPQVQKPSLFFECQVDRNRVNEIERLAHKILFEIELANSNERSTSRYNILYEKNK